MEAPSGTVTLLRQQVRAEGGSQGCWWGAAPRAEPALAIVFEQGLCKQRYVRGPCCCGCFLLAAAGRRFSDRSGSRVYV